MTKLSASEPAKEMVTENNQDKKQNLLPFGVSI